MYYALTPAGWAWRRIGFLMAGRAHGPVVSYGPRSTPKGSRAVATGAACSPKANQRNPWTPMRCVVFSPRRGEGKAMPGTYSQILLHVVFSTKARAAFIKPELQSRLHDYIGGIVRAEKGILYAIGGMPDHVHLLLRWRTDGTIADLMRTVKSRSSLWVHQTFPRFGAFGWQEGYSAFSVSKSAEADVKAYIEKQADHHQKRDFQQELFALLRAHGVSFDPGYVLD